MQYAGRSGVLIASTAFNGLQKTSGCSVWQERIAMAKL